MVVLECGLYLHYRCVSGWPPPGVLALAVPLASNDLCIGVIILYIDMM
jgi:hypothetical protein